MHQPPWFCIKDALLTSHITEGLSNFNITSVIGYFIEANADYKDIRQSSFQMFDRGHVQVCYKCLGNAGT
jgi:hypothetical protein